MRLALAQIDSVVGDLDGNPDRIVTRLEQARNAGAGLVLFPELAVTGYPPEDLLLRPGFVRAAERALAEIARATTGIVALVGTPHADGNLFNACAVCSDGEVKAIYRKQLLPNYGVFDEERYFTLESNDPDWSVSRIKSHYGLENFADYHARATEVQDRHWSMTRETVSS